MKLIPRRGLTMHDLSPTGNVILIIYLLLTSIAYGEKSIKKADIIHLYFK